MSLIVLMQHFKNAALVVTNRKQQRLPKHEKFVASAFTRWFFVAVQTSAPQDLMDGICPRGVIDMSAVRQDLQYAQQKLHLTFPSDYLAHLNSLRTWFDTQAAQLSLSSGAAYASLRLDSLVTKPQLHRLKSLYSGPKAGYVVQKNKLLQLYSFIGMNTIHMSVPPIFPNGTVELFGSPLNTRGPFCSPFPFEQTHFSSLGSFWTFNLATAPAPGNVFIANPPFDEHLIREMALRLLQQLTAPEAPECVIYVTLPVWDTESQRQYGLKDFGMPFEGLDILLKSPLCKGHAVLDDKEYKYFNYFSGQALAVSWTHLLMLSNATTAASLAKYPDIAEITTRWSNWSN